MRPWETNARAAGARARPAAAPAVLLVLVVLVAPVLAGCTQPPADGGDGGDGDGDGGDGVDGMHAQCVELRGQQSADDRAVRNASNPTVRMETNCGTVRLELYVDLTPITADNFLNLTRDGFYDGTRFHRVIEGFMVQDGDPNSRDPANKDKDPRTDADAWGRGGPGYTISDEFPCDDGTVNHTHPGSYQAPADQCDGHGGFRLTHDGPGVLSMANSGPSSGGSQYFITVTATPHLDGYHSIFGQVVEGMQVVHAISKVDTNDRDQPIEDVVIQDVAVEGGT